MAPMALLSGSCGSKDQLSPAAEVGTADVLIREKKSPKSHTETHGNQSTRRSKVAVLVQSQCITQ